MRRFFVLLLLGLVGCHSIQPPPESDTPTAPDDWLHVRDAFRDIVGHAQRGDRAAVARGLERFVLTEPEMVALFGEVEGRRVYVRYRDEIVADLMGEAPGVIIAKVRAGFTEVEVDRLGPARPANTTPGDQAMLEALTKKRPMFNLRLRPPSEPLGLRFDGFLFLDGRWRFLFKTYLFLGQN